MAKTQKKEKQLALIDIEPKNMKEILKKAREYKNAQTQRLSWLASEKEFKHEVLALVKEAKLQPLEDGVIRFHCDGVIISVTPRDELIRVKECDATE